MANKPFVYILILFIFAGIFHYDRFLNDQGRVGLVSRIIDYVGIAQFEPVFPSETKREIHDQFQFNIQNFEKINDQIQRIQDQRLQLWINRMEILMAIDDLNVDIEEEGLILTEVIFDEIEQFFEHFPQIEELGQAIIDANDEPDPEIRQMLFDGIEEDLLVSLAQVVDDPNVDMPRLIEFFDLIENMVGDVPDVVIEHCADIDLEQCLTESVDVQADLIEMITATVESQDIDKLFLFAELLYNEEIIQLERYESGEKNLDENPDQIGSEFKQLVMQLDAVLLEDLRLLNELNYELQRDQSTLMLYRKIFERDNSKLHNIAYNTNLLKEKEQSNRFFQRLKQDHVNSQVKRLNERLRDSRRFYNL